MLKLTLTYLETGLVRPDASPGSLIVGAHVDGESANGLVADILYHAISAVQYDLPGEVDAFRIIQAVDALLPADKADAPFDAALPIPDVDDGTGPQAWFRVQWEEDFEESVDTVLARHERWRSGEIRPLNRFGQEASASEIDAVIAEQRAKRGLPPLPPRDATPVINANNVRYAVFTRYLGPTNTRGARIVAKCVSRRVIVPYDHAASSLANHIAAFKALAAKNRFNGNYVIGDDGDAGYVFVAVEG